MKKTLRLGSALLLCLGFVGCSPTETKEANYEVIPLPKEIVKKLSSFITSEETDFATSLPLFPILRETSAFFKDNESLTPSPVIPHIIFIS